MAKPKIGIIISSTRDTRFADKPTQWVYNIASHESSSGGVVWKLK